MAQFPKKVSQGPKASRLAGQPSHWLLERMVSARGVFSAGYTPASQQDSINCTSDKYFFQESFLAPNHTKFSCKFTADMLQNCSGLEDPDFGFEEGKPCFIIKMNRVSTKDLLGQGPREPSHTQKD